MITQHVTGCLALNGQVPDSQSPDGLQPLGSLIPFNAQVPRG